jgi:hypothetical protein
VNNVNRPPVLNPIGSKTVEEGNTLQFTVTGSDPDGDGLTFSITSLPPGAIFDGQTFIWTTGFDQAGTYTVEFFVQDDGSPPEVDGEIVTITVGNTNRAPVFDFIGPQQIVEGQKLQFHVNAIDLDGDSVTYSSSSLPQGATFDPSSRLFSWTPSYGQAGSCTVTFYAKDNAPQNSMTGETSVVISVNQPSPSELIKRIIQLILDLHLPKAVENSYIANLKKVEGFIDNGQKTPAVNQLNAFIGKLNQDMTKGLIGYGDGNLLIQMATELLTILNT